MKGEGGAQAPSVVLLWCVFGHRMLSLDSGVQLAGEVMKKPGGKFLRQACKCLSTDES